MEYVLTAENLTKEYKGFRALDGLALRVPKGAIYGLVGKNGAGKTTLIRILCALQEPSAGHRKVIAVVTFENDKENLYPHPSFLGD